METAKSVMLAETRRRSLFQIRGVAALPVMIAAWAILPSCLAYEPDELDVRNAGSTLLLNARAANASDTLVGTITGLISTPITLQNNGSGSLVVSANGTFDFGKVPSGSAYSITIQTQPTNARCFVENGTGTFQGVVTNVVVTCPIAYVGGVLYFRCAHGQQWNSTAGDCTGTGNAGNNYGAAQTQFCTTNDNACNGAVNGGALASGPLFTACNNLNATSFLGINTWRAASGAELKNIVSCSNGPATPMADETDCNGGSATPTVLSPHFPNTLTDRYVSSTAGACCGNSNGYQYYTNGRMTYGDGDKTFLAYARCVSW